MNQLRSTSRKLSSIIGKQESDKFKPSIDVAIKLANVLDTTVGYLLGENEDKNVL